MTQSPKSLTAIVYVRFHHEVPEKQPRSEEAEWMGRIFDRASEMEPELQEILVDFANYLSKIDRKAGQSPE